MNTGRRKILDIKDIHKLDWKKTDGLIPTIVQNQVSLEVLMLGFMNEPSLQKTFETGYVTFYSRSKKRLWTKGESSKNFLYLDKVYTDCDEDSLLIFAKPQGPTCHLGSRSCFGDTSMSGYLEEQTAFAKLWSSLGLKFEAYENKALDENSYTHSLLGSGIKRIAQKVGEEGVEVALAAVTRDKAELCSELADLYYHLCVLMRASNISPGEVAKVLTDRVQPTDF